MLEKTLESPLDCKEIQPVHPKGDQAWIFIGRTDAEGEAPILWSPNAKNWLTGKDPDAGKDGGEWDDRGWDGWMASLTQWTWVWASSGSWWWTGKPDVVQSMGSQSRTWLSDWTTRAQQQISLLIIKCTNPFSKFRIWYDEKDFRNLPTIGHSTYIIVFYFLGGGKIS